MQKRVTCKIKNPQFRQIMRVFLMQVSLVDIVYYSAHEYLVASGANVCEGLMKLFESVGNIPAVAKYVKERTHKLFF